VRFCNGKFSLSLGLQYGYYQFGFGLRNTIGYGINDGGFMTCQNMIGESSYRTLFLPLGVMTGAYFNNVLPAVRNTLKYVKTVIVK
jgi:hypothetical protein